MYIVAASTAVLSMALGCAVGGPLMDRVGRKLAHLITCVFFALGWFLLAGWPSLPVLYAGRFLTGLCVGIISPVSTVYIAETAGPRTRGALLAAVSFCIALGVLLVHLLGALLSWDRVSAISACLPLACLVFIWRCPESPHWLHSVGRSRDAQRARAWFGVEHEEEVVVTLQKQDKARSGSFWKPFLLMCLFFLVQQCSGVNAVTFYTVQILCEVGLPMDEYVATLLLDAVRLLFCTAACYLLRILDRRTLCAVSGLGTGAAMLALALVGNRFPGLPVVLLGCYVAFVSVGLVPLPWIMVGEVFPASRRGLGSGLSSCFGFLVFFMVVQTSPAMLAALDTDWTFAVYGLVSILGTGLLLIWLPETRNKTLQEIEEQLAR